MPEKGGLIGKEAAFHIFEGKGPVLLPCRHIQRNRARAAGVCGFGGDEGGGKVRARVRLGGSRLGFPSFGLQHCKCLFGKVRESDADRHRVLRRERAVSRMGEGRLKNQQKAEPDGPCGKRH